MISVHNKVISYYDSGISTNDNQWYQLKFKKKKSMISIIDSGKNKGR